MIWNVFDSQLPDPKEDDETISKEGKDSNEEVDHTGQDDPTVRRKLKVGPEAVNDLY